MQVRPLTPPALVRTLAAAIVGAAHERRALGEEQGLHVTGHLRVGLDGPPAAGGSDLADALVEPLRAAGRAALRVRAGDFLRAASVRLERGREDPDAYYEDWLDEHALVREVLHPLGPDGDGRYLPTLRDSSSDRPTRASYLQAPPGAVLLLDGALLLGRWLPLDLTVHLALSPAARARRTAPQLAWTLPAYDRYDSEVGPAQAADLVVRLDDPQRPALVVPD